MLPIDQPEILILIRALSLYLQDEIENSDLENAAKTAKLLYILSHEVSTNKLTKSAGETR